MLIPTPVLVLEFFTLCMHVGSLIDGAIHVHVNHFSTIRKSVCVWICLLYVLYIVIISSL